ncbi:MAG: MarR family winged helix-turn-helix transcriptional regulator [Erythrobacter sp.]|jgi:DNA-binding MarR family transcriptional regulator|nr:MarR family winged helix-turn-helix transcriptional regulator [Erythrobacter sp.]
MKLVEPEAKDDARAERGDLAGFLPYQLSIASNAVSALIAERYRARFALKIPEWRVIAVLGDTGRKGAARAPAQAMTQREIGKATLMDKVAVSRACKVLEERCLIARVPNTDDGRSHLMGLTPEGKAIHEEVMPLARLTESELFAGFEPAEREALRAMLGKLHARAEELASRSL